MVPPIGVLIVDDSPGYAEILASRLDGEGWNIFIATSGAEALRILQYTPDIAIMASDFLMPELDGAQLVNRAFAYRPDLYTIIFTGWDDRAYAVQSLQAGVDAFIDKTDKIDSELRSAIRKGVQQVALYRIGRRLLDLNREDDIFELIVASLEVLRQIDGCFLAVRCGEGDVCRIERAKDLRTGADLAAQEITEEDSAYQYVVSEGCVYLPPLFQPEGRQLKPFLKDSHSMVVVPLTLRAGEKGALGIENSAEGRFSVEDLHFLNQVASSVSLATQKLAHQRRIAELERERGQNRRDLLAWAVLHEIKNPLNNLSMRIQSTGSELTTEDRMVLLDNIKRINNTIKEFAKPYSQEKAREEVDMATVILDAVERFRLREAKIPRLQIDISPALPTLKGSREMLVSVFVNLLENGAAAVGDGGEIRLTAVYVPPPRDRVEVVVKDDGPGIQTELLERVFDYGFSIHEKEGKFGFGLALTKEIVRLHGGSIDLSSAEGAGTTFKLSFPVDA